MWMELSDRSYYQLPDNQQNLSLLALPFCQINIRSPSQEQICRKRMPPDTAIYSRKVPPRKPSLVEAAHSQAEIDRHSEIALL